MEWTESGVVSLAVLEAVRRNGELPTWRAKQTYPPGRSRELARRSPERVQTAHRLAPGRKKFAYLTCPFCKPGRRKNKSGSSVRGRALQDGSPCRDHLFENTLAGWMAEPFEGI